jgi:hypothetical protein
MKSPSLPPRLAEAIAADLAPVRPLAHPARRAAGIALWIAAVGAATTALHPLRPDLEQLGALAGWGLTALETLAGAALVALAFAAGVPGSGIGVRRLRLGLAGALGVALLAALVNWLAGGRLAGGLAGGSFCTRRIATIGGAVLLMAIVLLARAWALRPGWAGAVCGAGAALAADGLWHLVCPRTELGHLLVWHLGGAVAVALAGAAAGLAAGALRHRAN